MRLRVLLLFAAFAAVASTSQSSLQAQSGSRSVLGTPAIPPAPTAPLSTVQGAVLPAVPTGTVPLSLGSSTSAPLPPAISSGSGTRFETTTAPTIAPVVGGSVVNSPCCGSGVVSQSFYSPNQIYDAGTYQCQGNLGRLGIPPLFSPRERPPIGRAYGRPLFHAWPGY